MADQPWEYLSPLCSTFRAYDIEANREVIMEIIRSELEKFKSCSQIQIEITAPPKEPADVAVLGEESVNSQSGAKVVMGFAGGE